MTNIAQRRPNKVRRAESTAKVEAEAIRQFVERGYRGTSINSIAKAVGLTKGAVYFYYSDKERLLLTLLGRSEAQFFTAIFEAMWEKAGDEHSQIDLFLEQMVRAGGQLDRYLLILPVLMSVEFKDQGGAVEARVREIYDHVYDRLSEVIASGQENGMFTDKKGARALAAMIVALTDGLVLDIYRKGSGVSGREIGDAARYVVKGLLTP